MGRKRLTNKHLPHRLYWSGMVRQYFYYPKGGKRIWLGMDLSQALRRYGEMIATPAQVTTCADVISAYNVRCMSDLSPRTQTDRITELRNIRNVFGHMAMSAITIGNLLDWKAANWQRPVRWNREKAAMSSLFGLAIELRACERNLCPDVKNYTEKPRERLPSVVELEQFKEFCRAEGDTWLALYVELKQRIGLRQADMLNLTTFSVEPTGLAVKTAKTGHRLLYAFYDEDGSTGLKELVDGILDLPPKRTKFFNISQSGFKTRWQRMMKKFTAEGNERFTEHDIRASAGVRAAEGNDGNAQRLLGHTQAATTNRYIGRRSTVKVIPNKK